MDSDDDEDSWDMIDVLSDDEFSVAANNEAKAAQHNLQQEDLRQASNCVYYSVSLFCLGYSKTSARLRDMIAQNNAVRTSSQGRGNSWDHATTTEIENAIALDEARFKNLPKLPLEDQRPRTGRDTEPEQYSASMTQALHATFHETTILPCSCRQQGRTFRVLENHVCALRLDGKWEVAGDDSHCFFDSVVARRVDENCEWIHLQIQLPKVINQVRHAEPPDNSHRPTEPQILRELDDFCWLFEWNPPYQRIPIRLEGDTTHRRLYVLNPEHSDISTEKHASVPLLQALQGNCLTARSKIYLAFTLSRSFWQFYESPWMQATWNLETIHLLPQCNNSHATIAPGAKTPFLTIVASEPEKPYSLEYEPKNPSNQYDHLHRYPYILNLGLLLVLLCSSTPSRDFTSLTGPRKINAIYGFCRQQSISEEHSWPAIDLSDKHREDYRSIAKQCLPNPCAQIGLDATERRTLLRDKVVRPLYDLLQGMQDPDTNDSIEAEAASIQANVRVGTSIDKIVETPRYVFDSVFSSGADNVFSEESRRWVDKIKQSSLRRHVSRALNNDEAKKRPKVAVIDTGYDATSSFIGNSQRNRFSPQFGKADKQYHWKDFWQKKDEPQDEDGHGTSMLSTIIDIAPFADICVARIAGSDSDLRAILWAVEDHDADIISMSLGWEQEPSFEGRSVVKNAISASLGKKDQKVLFFAATSNFGGGRHELYPAKYGDIFSIRATDTLGKHQSFNAALPERSDAKVYGTLGVNVPTAQRGRTDIEIGRTGTSVATAITAALAAIIIGYININDKNRSWDKIRTHDGFQNLLDRISTETDTRKRFITLETLCQECNRMKFESHLDSARWAS
ncbi:MAG: hypothetical protein M1839_001621 [Geoglossum umbratile]|nr:MAG: hypothetical protein M1839_001621 [Geoglossum umbratile]